MKLPNSYGSVIKPGGKRRKPYAVRISKLVEDDTGKVKRNTPTWLTSPNRKWLTPILLNTIAVRLFQSI